MRDASDYRRTAAKMRVPFGLPDDRLAELAPLLFAQVPLDPGADTSGDALHVAANHGRWVVQCPDCLGAQLAHHADPRFLCTDCGNAGNGGRYRPVVWPENHRELGEVLDARAAENTRHWLAGETVSDLRAENEHMPSGPTLLEVPWAAKNWEGHTHRYPAVSKRRGLTATCRDCGLVAERTALDDEPDEAENLTGVSA